MNNVVYGKTMENLRNEIDVKLVSNEKDKLWIKKNIFDNNLVAICKSKITLTLNRPAFVGMIVLDLSKVLMYEFQYDYAKKNMVTAQDYYSVTLIV